MSSHTIVSCLSILVAMLGGAAVAAQREATSRVDAIQSATFGSEPLAINYSDSGVLQGFVNYASYTPCNP